MGNDMVPPDFPPLSNQEVRLVLSRVPSLAARSASASVVWRSPRPFSATAIVSLAGVAPGKLSRSSSQCVVVKRHCALARSRASLELEHDFMRHLASGGLQVPRVLDDGACSAWEEGGFVYEAQQVLPGEDLYAQAPSWTPYMSQAHAASAGAALAVLHLASSSYEQPARPVEPLWASARTVSSESPLDEVEELASLLPGLGEYLRARPGWRKELHQALAPYHEAFLPYAGELRPLWCHNDWHPSNLLWAQSAQQCGASPEKVAATPAPAPPATSAPAPPATAARTSANGTVTKEAARAGQRSGHSSEPRQFERKAPAEPAGEVAGAVAAGEVAGVIDFSLANLTSALYDLATALERSVVPWLEQPDRRRANLGQADALLEGYCSVRPLSPSEAQALGRLLPLVHVDYALSEIDYFVRVARSAANANLAWGSYLLGHLRWWATPPGRHLLSNVAARLSSHTVP